MKDTFRIKKNKTFRYILKKGNFIRGKYVNIYITNSNNNKINNFGICVSKKNGNSVQRNKLKRWAREVYKNNEKNIKKGYNLVFLYKKETTTNILNYNLLNSEVIRILKVMKIYEK
ncbi:MAG: ribonuclease P protein component [Clostridia bacterium]